MVQNVQLVKGPLKQAHKLGVSTTAEGLKDRMILLASQAMRTMLAADPFQNDVLFSSFHISKYLIFCPVCSLKR